MAFFRNILPVITFVLLIGMAFASMEDTFYCSDGHDQESHATDTDCCTQCLTVHTMATSPTNFIVKAIPYPNLKSDFAFIDSLHSDAHPSSIDRPPIA